MEQTGDLGGVKDVDQDTYITPEVSAGSDEDVLYFYNANNNTLQLNTQALDFYTIDTVRSLTSDEFELTASLLTIDQAATTLDNGRSDTILVLQNSSLKLECRMVLEQIQS